MEVWWQLRVKGVGARGQEVEIEKLEMVRMGDKVWLLRDTPLGGYSHIGHGREVPL